MSADLHIHAMGIEGAPGALDERDLKCFFSNQLGSKYFNMSGQNCAETGSERWSCVHHDRVTTSDSVWIGEVSWLKAALFDDDDYVPEPVEAVSNLIGDDLPVLTDELMEKILEAVEVPQVRAQYYRVTDDSDIIMWLANHKGQRLFIVSW